MEEYQEVHPINPLIYCRLTWSSEALVFFQWPVWLTPFKTHGTGMEENRIRVEPVFLSPLHGHLPCLNLEKGQVAQAVPSTFLFLKRQNGLTGEDRALRRHPWVHPDCISPWAGYLHLRCLSFLTWKQWLCHQPACRGPVRAGCEYSCTEFRLSAQELKEPLRWP